LQNCHRQLSEMADDRRRITWFDGWMNDADLELLLGDYVFEPNDAVFRRSVQRGFEATLTRLFVLGAFAGATPDDAFRVEVGSPPNTQVTLDAGQLIVDLKVAPSRPLSFITVRLVGESDGSFRVDTR